MASSTSCPVFAVRSALPSDVRAIRDLVDPLAARRILLPKELVGYYEAVQEFLVACAVGPLTVGGSDPVGHSVPAGDSVPPGHEAGHSVPAGDSVPAGREAGRSVPAGRKADTFAPGRVLGAGALHVMWEDLAEIRTLAVADDWRGKGVGHALLAALTDRARDLGLSRLFCLTFETEFFARHGFEAIDGTVVSPDIYTELLRSQDDGVAEFLDLARVKPNTLGNTRMLKHL